VTQIPHFEDYFWKDGKPVGIRKTPPEAISFRIITDPYKKRFSVEKYSLEKCQEVIYDSNLFDFRHLKNGADAAWQRECIEEKEEQDLSYIRNMDERIILKEEAFFSGNFCRSCKIYSPHGVLIAIQKILHRSQGDPFNGVILQDILEHPILVKHYELDESSGEFTTLLKEIWDHQRAV
jgi:hypothetical protein